MVASLNCRFNKNLGQIWDAHLFQHSNATCLYFLWCYVMEFLSHGDQSQTFPKFYFQTWGKGTKMFGISSQILLFFYGIPYQLFETFQTLPCLPINYLLKMYVQKIRGLTWWIIQVAFNEFQNLRYSIKKLGQHPFLLNI